MSAFTDQSLARDAMSPMASDLNSSETRVTAAEPIRGDNGDIEIIVQQSSDSRDQEQMHRFIFEYFSDTDNLSDVHEYRGMFVAWEPGTGNLLLDDFKAFEHAERYLQHHGVYISRHLSDGMYRPAPDEDLVKNDVELEIH